MLLRVAGRDDTAQFMRQHPGVAADVLLHKCLVGWLAVQPPAQQQVVQTVPQQQHQVLHRQQESKQQAAQQQQEQQSQPVVQQQQAEKYVGTAVVERLQEGWSGRGRRAAT